MKQTFNSRVAELIRNGMDSLDALKEAENSGEFSEEEIAEWYKKFNERRLNN